MLVNTKAAKIGKKMAKTHKGILQRPPILPYLDLQIQGHLFVLKSGGGIVKVVVGLRERGH